jgi:O-antigen/teichoic acid export membrane protein
MNWKLFLKLNLVIGILLIPLNILYAGIAGNPFYDVASLKYVILLIGLTLLAAVSIFRFVYRRTEKFRIIQSIATIVLSQIIGFILLTAGIMIFLIIFS